jgi:MFS family permease
MIRAIGPSLHWLLARQGEFRGPQEARERRRAVASFTESKLMNEGKVMNRWIVVVGAILIQLCLGAIYAWSVFTKKLTLPQAEGGYGFTASQTQWIFSAGLATFALVMLYAGRWQARVGPRTVAAVGGIVLGAGYILGGLFGSSFWLQFVCIGIIGGAGIGLGYVVPIAVGVKWFPDKKGMITGLAVAGFGFGATIWVKLGDSWFGGLLNTTHVFGLPGVQSVFFIYGVTFLVLVLLASTVMINPPVGWKPAVWNPGAAGVAGRASGALDLTAGQMAGTPQYWGLLLMFTGSAMAGLMVIGCIKLFGIDSLQASKVAKDAAEAGTTAGTAMAFLAILNGLGRIIWGTLSDKIGRKTALFLMCLIQGIMMLLFFKVGASQLGLIIGACVIGFNFGGNFALFPAATADFFGNKNVGTNYPWVFLAYGIAGIAGPQIAGYFKDSAKGAGVGVWHTPFILAGLACLVAAALALMLKAPKPRAEPQPPTQPR